MNDENQNDSAQLEVMPPSASLAIETASINSQITTAKAYPRSLQVFKKRAIDMATLDEETAESCLYRRPVGGGKFAEGMSVRMSEIVGASYGNLRVRATIVEQTERFVRARGEAIDLESNFASSSECIESTVKKDGTPYDERMRVVIAKSALSKARRDAMFQVVPRALAKPVENAVRSLLLGDTKTLEARRQLVVQWISKTGIGAERVYAALGIKGEADLGVDQLEVLTGIRTALKDGEVTLDEAFPPLTEPVKRAPVPERAKTGATAAKAAASAAKEVVVEPEPVQAEPAPAPEPPKPAEPAPTEAAPAPTQGSPRAFLNEGERLTAGVQVVSLFTALTKGGEPVVVATVKGDFVGEVQHNGGAKVVEAGKDPVPNPEWVVGNSLTIGLVGKKLKSGKVQARVESVAVVAAVKPGVEE